MMVYHSSATDIARHMQVDSLSATIVTDDHCKRRVEFDDLDVLVVEAPNAPDGKLVKRSPGSIQRDGSASNDAELT